METQDDFFVNLFTPLYKILSTTPRQSQSGRNVFDIITRELTDPIPVPSLPEGKGAWRAGWGVYNVKIGDSERIFDFAIAL
jgi:hypothetical protein